MRASSDPESVKTLDFIKNAIDQELKDRYEKKKKEDKKTSKQTSEVEEPTVFENAQDYIDKMLDYTEKKR